MLSVGLFCLGSFCVGATSQRQGSKSKSFVSFQHVAFLWEEGILRKGHWVSWTKGHQCSPVTVSQGRVVGTWPLCGCGSPETKVRTSHFVTRTVGAMGGSGAANWSLSPYLCWTTGVLMSPLKGICSWTLVPGAKE